MIRTPTVLILGAGASADYGFPLGRRLRDLVCEFPRSYAAKELLRAGFKEEELSRFVDTLRHSGYTSVDWFLERWPEFIPIGKASIAAVLIPLEDPDRLFPPRSPEQHWYELLLNTLDSDEDRFTENRLSIVTFNYDRSIEHYLFTALHTRRRSEKVADADFANIEIIHVHGSLGKFLPREPAGRGYSPTLDAAAIRQAAEEIIVVGEASDDTREFERARSVLSGARRIVFLGFGFHRESVRRLAVFNDHWDDARHARVAVSGTSRGIPTHEWNRIQREVLNNGISSKSRSECDVFLFLNQVKPIADWAL